MVPQVPIPADWNSLTLLLLSLWLFAFVTITFAINVLIGHAILPSLSYTHELPFWLSLIRPVFYVIAVLAFAADVFIVIQLGNQLGILPAIYPHVLI